MKRFHAALTPAFLTGAFFALALGWVVEPGVARVVLLSAGGAYGVAVLGLIRLFRVAAWARPIAGLLAGPVPAALLRLGELEDFERAWTWAACAVLGLLVGLIEQARLRAS